MALGTLTSACIGVIASVDVIQVLGIGATGGSLATAKESASLFLGQLKLLEAAGSISTAIAGAEGGSIVLFGVKITANLSAGAAAELIIAELGGEALAEGALLNLGINLGGQNVLRCLTTRLAAAGLPLAPTVINILG